MTLQTYANVVVGKVLTPSLGTWTP